MIGAFFITDDNQVGFAQYGDHQIINGFSVTADHRCSVITDEGKTINFTEALAPEIYGIFLKVPHISVGHMSDKDKVLKEYTAPILVAV